jgi:hypothetical protein
MKETTLTHHIIVTGHFSKNGNFIGVDHNGKTIHIYEIQMEILNLKAIKDITFPLFAIGTVKTFNELSGNFGEENRKKIINAIGETKKFDRLTSKAIFKNFENLIDAYAQESALNVDFNTEYVEENKVNAENAFKKYYDYRISLYLPVNNNVV